MSINWYPGHMHKAQKEIRQRLKEVDLFIEIVDARIPFSSENPLLAEIRGDLPCLKILNKTDLAEESQTRQWQDYLERNENTKTLGLNLHSTQKKDLIVSLCHKLVPEKKNALTPITCLITGIPNVGKSTLINTLTGKTIAKTGNEPAVTQRQQRIELNEHIVLFDTPGLLWPKVENEHSGYRLAITGAIKDTALDYESIAYYLAEYMLLAYPERLKERYQLEETPQSETALLEHIGRLRGCLISGGRIDFHKVSTLFINEFRDGVLGALTLETPEMMQCELKDVELKRAEKLAKKKARLERRKKR